MQKLSEISVEKYREHFGLRRNFSVQSGPVPEVVLLTGRFGPTETCHTISKNSRFQTYFGSINQNLDRFDLIGNFASTEQCHCIFSYG